MRSMLTAALVAAALVPGAPAVAADPLLTCRIDLAGSPARPALPLVTTKAVYSSSDVSGTLGCGDGTTHAAWGEAVIATFPSCGAGRAWLFLEFMLGGVEHARTFYVDQLAAFAGPARIEALPPNQWTVDPVGAFSFRPAATGPGQGLGLPGACVTAFDVTGAFRSRVHPVRRSRARSGRAARRASRTG